VIEHVPDPMTFVESGLATLKIGGTMIIATPNDNSFLRYVTNGILNMPPHHITRWSDETFKWLAKRYNLDIVDIYHEKLQDYHKLWYLSVLVSNIFMENKLIDTGIRRIIINRVSNLIGRCLIKGLKYEMLPDGHTVSVVYRKTNKQKM
jgi:hypothetical protein